VSILTPDGKIENLVPVRKIEDDDEQAGNKDPDDDIAKDRKQRGKDAVADENDRDTMVLRAIPKKRVKPSPAEFHHHFVGTWKPWFKDCPDDLSSDATSAKQKQQQVRLGGGKSNGGSSMSPNSYVLLWYYTLQRINVELKLGIDVCGIKEAATRYTTADVRQGQQGPLTDLLLQE